MKMCRMLIVKSGKEFEIREHLKKFAEVSRNSKEYQGHGWGCCYVRENKWVFYKNIKPIWKDNLENFGKTRLLVGHARSAFMDKDIIVENNMPFYDGKHVFVFNGELQGVKINEKGRIGAEKIFNFIKRFDKGDIAEALRKGTSIIKKRARYVKAMNIIILDKEKICVASMFNENPEYFTMHFKEDNGLAICSGPYDNENKWKKIKNNAIRCFK